MKNLQKFTKAELIARINKSKDNQNNLTITSLIITKLVYFKSLILKITLLAFIIKYFKRYSLFRRLWAFFNWLVMAIFGISILDLYDLNFFSSIFNYIRSTYFYTTISGILGFNTHVKEIPSSAKPMKGINTNPTGNEEKHKISDWINRQVDRQEIIEDKNETSYRKYLLLLWLLFLAGGLSWYYWGDISPHLPGLPGLPSFLKRKPKPKTDEMIPTGGENIELPINWPEKETKSWWDTLKFWKSNKTNIDINKVNDLKTEAANKSVSSKDSIDHYFPEIKLEDHTTKIVEVAPQQLSEQDKFKGMFEQITGENQNNFNLKAQEVAGQMNKFLELNKTNGFPNEEIKNALYGVLSTNLGLLSLKYKHLYEQWLNDNSDVANLVNKFANLDAASNHADNQSEIYEQVELETIQEQDVWSDKVKSPSVKSEAFNNYAVEQTEVVVEKPKSIFSNWLEAINARRDDTNVVGSPDNQANKQESILLETSDFINEPYKVTKIGETQELLNQAKDLRKEANEVRSTLDELIDKSNKLDDSSLLSAVKKRFHDPSQSSGIANYDPNYDISKKFGINRKNELPEIKIDTTGSDNSLDHYFPKVDKGKAIDTTNLSQAEIERRASSSATVIEDTKVEVPDEQAHSIFGSLMDQIKSKRLEYGTPKISQLGLRSSTPQLESPKVLSPLKTKPSITNLFDDTADLFDIDNNDIDVTETTQEEIQDNNANITTHEEIQDNNANITTQEEIQDIDNSNEAVATPAPNNTPVQTPVVSPQASSSSNMLLKNDQDDNDSIAQKIIDNLTHDKFWNNIETNIVDNNQVSINFKELYTRSDSIYFCAEDNFYSIYDLNKNPSLVSSIHSFNWREFADSSTDIPQQFGLKQIFVKDFEGKFHSIYKNDKYFK